MHLPTLVRAPFGAASEKDAEGCRIRSRVVYPASYLISRRSGREESTEMFSNGIRDIGESRTRKFKKKTTNG